MNKGIFELLQYDFFTSALWASVLASISCGIAGSYIVARRMVFVSGGITHASFGGIGIAWFLGINPVLGAAVFSIFTALGIEFFTTRTKIREDSAIGIWWSLGMALGIIFIFITPGYAPNLMSFLFGSILTVSHTDLWLMGGLSVLLIFVFMRYYHLILFISFDEAYARSHQAPVSFFKYLLITLVALTIVLNIRVAGIILVISFLTIPPSIANLFTHSMVKVMAGAVVAGLLGSITGLIASYYFNIPSGATIIFAFVLMFAIAKVIQRLMIQAEMRTQLGAHRERVNSKKDASLRSE
ncbi:MAG: metal ABC transporter permease [Lentimicrobium sp.]|jgi:zinc transport system permease protein|nr:metal ABC transporter permease [Lentimicrobium sp.]MDD4597853.1 metal ABC transporter permease [Lentimicrobiaceae bacterium]MDY0025029.1 metal ABC transporter permease [Lentimicrobium sp.]